MPADSAVLFAGTTLPQATRDIMLGVIVLIAIITLRERTP
jgi:hypothetical protein